MASPPQPSDDRTPSGGRESGLDIARAMFEEASLDMACSLRAFTNGLRDPSSSQSQLLAEAIYRSPELPLILLTNGSENFPEPRSLPFVGGATGFMDGGITIVLTKDGLHLYGRSSKPYGFAPLQGTDRYDLCRFVDLLARSGISGTSIEEALGRLASRKQLRLPLTDAIAFHEAPISLGVVLAPQALEKLAPASPTHLLLPPPPVFSAAPSAAQPSGGAAAQHAEGIGSEGVTHEFLDLNGPQANRATDSIAPFIESKPPQLVAPTITSGQYAARFALNTLCSFGVVSALAFASQASPPIGALVAVSILSGLVLTAVANHNVR